MMSRVLSPASVMHPASSIAQLNELMGPADTIPALGFARSGNESRMARPGTGAGVSGSTTWGANPYGTSSGSYHRTPHTHEPKDVPLTSRHMTHTFNTTTRNGEVRYNPLATRKSSMDSRPTRAPNPDQSHQSSQASTQPGLASSQFETAQATRVKFSPAPLAHTYPAPQSQPQPLGVSQNPYARHSSPSSAYKPPQSNPNSNPNPNPNPNPDPTTSPYSYPAAPRPASSLAPPASNTLTRRRSPSPLPLSKLDTEAKAQEGQLVATPGNARVPSRNSNNNTSNGNAAGKTPENRHAMFIDSPVDYYSQLNGEGNATSGTNAAGKVPENRQATFIDSPIDYYSRLDSKVSALPPSSGAVSIGPLVSITSVPPTPEYNKQSFSAAQTSPQFATLSQQTRVQYGSQPRTQTTSHAYPTMAAYSYAPAYPQPHAYPQQQPHIYPQQQPRVYPQQPHAIAQALPRTSSPQNLRMCVVCFETEPDIRFAARSPTAQCGHGASVCTSCLERHILITTKGMSVDVRCPHDGCGKKLEYRDIYASVRDWAKLVSYEELLLRKEMENDECFVWCKNPRCKSGQLHKDAESKPMVTCTTCRSKSCFKHDRPWHDGMTCDEFDKRLKLEEEEHRKATETYLAVHTKTCPNEKCGRKIERNGGCDHMFCRPPGGCGHEFCWQCLASLGEHKPDCRHYSPPRRRRSRAHAHA